MPLKSASLKLRVARYARWPPATLDRRDCFVMGCQAQRAKKAPFAPLSKENSSQSQKNTHIKHFPRCHSALFEFFRPSLSEGSFFPNP
ncbi:MAG TPA: hypothetical protein DEP85_02610 [Holosporales bacterium]|nr:hypothetical protein [Holosporales bacterium]